MRCDEDLTPFSQKTKVFVVSIRLAFCPLPIVRTPNAQFVKGEVVL